jgi:hypothetical protein
MDVFADGVRILQIRQQLLDEKVEFRYKDTALVNIRSLAARCAQKNLQFGQFSRIVSNLNDTFNQRLTFGANRTEGRRFWHTIVVYQRRFVILDMSCCESRQKNGTTEEQELHVERSGSKTTFEWQKHALIKTTQ